MYCRWLGDVPLVGAASPAGGGLEVRVEEIVLIATLIVLIWQTASLKAQIKKSELQAIYNRYLELTKLEVDEPALHKMFMYREHYAQLPGKLTAGELRERALALLIFDQFSMIYNMSSSPNPFGVFAWFVNKLPELRIIAPARRFIDRHRTPFEINREYIERVVANPLMVRAWREWGLGDTWRGSEFYRFAEEAMDRGIASYPDATMFKERRSDGAGARRSTAGELRAWARERGYRVRNFGPIPKEVQAAYRKEMKLSSERDV